jgi:hypothetical protein
MLRNKLITEFLDEYGIPVREFESKSYIDSMLKTHQIIEYDNLKYYISINTKIYTNLDNLILNLLNHGKKEIYRDTCNE